MPTMAAAPTPISTGDSPSPPTGSPGPAAAGALADAAPAPPAAPAPDAPGPSRTVGRIPGAVRDTRLSLNSPVRSEGPGGPPPVEWVSDGLVAGLIAGRAA